MKIIRKCIIEDCNEKHEAKGYCEKHYARFKKYGNAEFTSHSIEEQKTRFWAKVNLTANESDCWNWQGLRTANGYGKTSMRIKGKDWRLAHRIAFYLFYGNEPKQNVCHKCDNTLCVNPHHLFEGTQKDNLQDMVLKGRSRKGERNHKAKLTEAQATLIKQRCKTEKVSRLAREFDVSFMAIQLIKQGKNWKHIKI